MELLGMIVLAVILLMVVATVSGGQIPMMITIALFAYMFYVGNAYTTEELAVQVELSHKWMLSFLAGSGALYLIILAYYENKFKKWLAVSIFLIGPFVAYFAVQALPFRGYLSVFNFICAYFSVLILMVLLEVARFFARRKLAISAP